MYKRQAQQHRWLLKDNLQGARSTGPGGVTAEPPETRLTPADDTVHRDELSAFVPTMGDATDPKLVAPDLFRCRIPNAIVDLPVLPFGAAMDGADT